MTMKSPSKARPPVWLQASEAGSTWGLRLIVLLGTAFGRGPVHVLLRVIVFYYAVFARTAMRASAQYLARVGQAHGFWSCYKHLLRFAQCATDRWFFVSGRHGQLEIHTHGHEHLIAAQRAGRGAVLLGAHLGSFEAMYASAETQGLVINVVGHFGNARRINDVLASFGGGVQTRLIEIEPGNINFMLRLRQCVERGELVALLADRRVGGASTLADFLGAPARFPTGAYVLAAALRCPVYMTFGLFTAPRRYDLYCEPFADAIVLTRGKRTEDVAQYVQRFADRLAHYCRLAPDNWFNFYDFWNTNA